MDDMDAGEDDGLENTPHSPSLRQKRKPNRGPKSINNFEDLKKYIEGKAYDKEVGAAIDGDGRLGSVADEGNIILWLNEIFDDTNVEVIKPPARYWYDIELKIGSKSYYTNIKTTAGVPTTFRPRKVSCIIYRVAKPRITRHSLRPEASSS